MAHNVILLLEVLIDCSVNQLCVHRELFIFHVNNQATVHKIKVYIDVDVID